MEFRIDCAAYDAVVAHAREAASAECCGLLIGRGDRIVRAVRARNLREEMDRFLIDPADHIAALRDARGRGMEVLGFYHSHPHSAARPSRTDLEEASYRDHVHMIVGLESERAPGVPGVPGVDVRLYAMGEREYREIPLVVDPRDISG